MTISEARFQADGSIVAVIDDNPIVISADPRNAMRKMVASWEQQGNTVAPFVQPVEAAPSQNQRRRALEVRDIGEPIGPVLRALIAAVAGDTTEIDIIKAKIAAIDIEAALPAKGGRP